MNLLPSRGLLLGILLTVPAAFTAYFRSFVGIEPYDDEGTLIEWVRGFLSGRPLYDSVGSIYGPAFFFYEWLAHTIAGRPITNDSVRFVSIAFWLASALLVFLLAWRVTGSWVIAAGTYLLAFRVLNFLGVEPAHPQELCLFLALALAFAGCFPKNRTVMMLWLGVLVGVTALTKINMGALVAVALGLVFVHATSLTAAWKAARIAAILGTLAFPLVLMLPNLTMPWAQRYFVLEELSLTAMALAVLRLRFDVRLGVREFTICGAGFVGAVAALALFVIARGSTLGAMIEWLIVKPRTIFGPAWYWAPSIGAGVTLWAALGLLAALLAQSRLAQPWMIAMAKLALSAGVFALAATNRSEQIMYSAPPFLWLVVMPQTAHPRLGPFSRALLGTMGILIVLYAFPVAGSQIAFVVVFLIGVAAVALGDGVYWLAQQLPSLKNWGRRLAYAVMAIALVRFCLFTPLRAREYYESLEPLGLPGATKLRLDPPDAAGLREIVSIARNSCAMLLTVPGMPSLNFWTGLSAPRGLGGGNWVTGLDDAEQQRIVGQIAGESRICVMYNAEQIAMWTHDADVSARPLIRYVRENFRPVATGRGNVLMVRR